MIIYNTASIKFRRVLAFVIDIIFIFLLINVAVDSVTIIATSSGKSDSFDSDIVVNILESGSLILLLRDFLPGGVSLGKRIMGLRILDFNTHKKPPIFKTILRDIFFIILPIDAITMFIEGRSVGDRVANTVVVTKKSINNPSCITLKDNANEHTETDSTIDTTCEADKESNEMKRVIITGAIFMLVVIGFLSLICFGWYSTL